MFLFVKRTLAPLTRLSKSSWIVVLATELAIVFVGVYLADLLAERRDEQFQRERQALILAALDRDIAPFVEQADLLVGNIRASFADWEKQRTGGMQPAPFYVPATMSLPNPHGALWSSLLDSGGLDLLPVELLADISEFYIRAERMLQRYRRLDDFVRQQILPNVDGDANEFYADAVKLRPMYAVYSDELTAALDYAAETIVLGKEIRAALATAPR